MKYRNTNKWDDVAGSKNLLFFAQIFDELFFDFSLDTYKPSAMNASLLCEEALNVISEIEKGNIKSPNLQHVLDELCENISKDRVAQELLAIELGQINSVLKDPKKAFDEKRIVVELVLRQIYLKKYKKKNEELLVFSIEGDEDFSVIRSLARSYATTLLNLGFSSEYIGDITQKFFHYDKNRISGCSAIKDFIKIFSGGPKDYCLIFKTRMEANFYAESLGKFKIKISENMESFGVDLKGQKLSRSKDEVYICVQEIKARDNYSAKHQAEQLLEMLSTIFSLFHHKDQLKWGRDCLIVNDANEVAKSRIRTNAMHKCVDQKLARAANQANRFLTEFGLEKNSFRVFTRSAELHSLALRSDSNENQMLNLWIALESIIPANTNDKISNIEHIIDSTMPFLNLGYYQRLVARLTRDLFNWDRSKTKNILKGIPGDSQVVKVAKLLALPEYEGDREKARNYFNDFYLLRDRFDYLAHIYSDPKNLVAGLKAHSVRVGWQIRRAYRARNMIVHSGITPSYIEMLIENVHDYLDHIIEKIISLVSDSQKVLSVEQAFKLTQMTCETLEVTLSKRGQKFSGHLISQMYGL